MMTFSMHEAIPGHHLQVIHCPRQGEIIPNIAVTSRYRKWLFVVHTTSQCLNLLKLPLLPVIYNAKRQFSNSLLITLVSIY